MPVASQGNAKRRDWHPVVMKVGDLGLKGMTNDCCGLCGYVGKLSKTHIPPKAAGNQGRARRLLELIDEHGSSFIQLKNFGTGGGGWGRWLCTDCNQKTGEWDDEYGNWSRNLVLGLHSAGVRPGRELPMHLRDVAPGAVVRAMWAWMFALDPNLRQAQPDLAAAVLSGDPVEPPSDLKLVIGATTSLGIWVSGQVGGHAFRTPVDRNRGYATASGIRVAGTEEVDAPEVAISSPPFVELLAEVGDEMRVPYTDTADWLREGAGDRREANLLLPVIRGLEKLDELALVTYEELVQ